MKNAREFFLQVSSYNGAFCFVTTCMASCNSAVTECEEMKTVLLLNVRQDEILCWSLYIHRALLKLNPTAVMHNICICL